MPAKIYTMKERPGNIFTFHDEVLGKEDKEALLGQRAYAVWMTGLSGSGKTTIAKILERRLHAEGFLTRLLDGDNVRDGLNRNLGFTAEDRAENIRRIAEVNKLFTECGVITINCFVSPTKEIRSSAKNIIGAEHFLEVFVDTPLEVCEFRDVKGLYKKARRGEIKNFTGLDAPFEAPDNPSLAVTTEGKTPEQTADDLYRFLHAKIKRK